MITLCDSGPLVALINAKDRDHARCRETIDRLRVPLVTTWVCLTEAMHLLGRIKGWRGQDELWGFLEDGALLLYDLTEEHRQRMRVLMARYQSTPMDMGDASLVVAAESLGQNVIFTLDSDFYVYRLKSGGSFQVMPE